MSRLNYIGSKWGHLSKMSVLEQVHKIKTGTACEIQASEHTNEHAQRRLCIYARVHTAVFCYIQPLNNGISTACKYFQYGFRLSIKYLENSTNSIYSKVFIYMYVNKICMRHKLWTFWRRWRDVSSTDLKMKTFRLN